MRFRAFEVTKVPVSRDKFVSKLPLLCEVLGLESLKVPNRKADQYDYILGEKRGSFNRSDYWVYMVKLHEDGSELIVSMESVCKGTLFVLKWEMVIKVQAFSKAVQAVYGSAV